MIPNTEDLFAHYCTHGLTMPDDFTKAPAFLILKNQLSSEQTRQLSALLDEQALTFCDYAYQCFQQGIRFALSLMQQLTRRNRHTFIYYSKARPYMQRKKPLQMEGLFLSAFTPFQAP